jgi:transposase
VLVEAAWSAARSPGPLRAFALRTAARRGKNVAAVAVARELCVLCWHLLTRGEDYAFQRPSLVRRKIRTLELRAGAPRREPQPLAWRAIITRSASVSGLAIPVRALTCE